MPSIHIARLMMRPAIGHLKLKPEEDIARVFATQLRVWTIEGRLSAVWTHVPNEIAGTRTARSADAKIRRASVVAAEIIYSIAKAMGLIPGAPDFFLLWEGGSGVIEFKTADGEQQQEQRWFQTWCEERGVPYRIARSPEEGYAILREWNVLKGDEA